MQRSLTSLLLVFLLCRCASKHQPALFEPYLPSQPEEVLSSGQLTEIADLESRPSLEPLEKKRLFDLYQIELKNLKSSSKRAVEVADKVKQLRPDIELLLDEVTGLGEPAEEPGNDKNEKLIFSNKELRQRYKTAYQAWNQDENVKALDGVEHILQSEELNKSTSSSEWLRVLNLRFRIAFDLKDFARLKEAYSALKSHSDCSLESAQAGFLMALLMFTQGAGEAAKTLFLEQCDPDSSVSNKTRRAYWLFRFSADGSSEQGKYYDELMASPLPGYYSYLALSKNGEEWKLPSTPNYVPRMIEVSSDVNSLISKAEERLRYGLRKDAVKFLLAAKSRLKKDSSENVQGLLYISRLFQSAGNHLESMKILTSLLLGDEQNEAISNQESLSEYIKLFHQPFRNEVEWYGKMWAVDPDFVFSIMRQESAFNPGAVSKAGAKGFMQLMPNLAKFLLEQWKMPKPSTSGYLFRGKENIRLATYHLNQLGHLVPHPALVAASYNAGINRVNSWWKRSGHYPLDVFVEFIPINETRNYVKLVLRNYLYYKGIRNEGKVPRNLISLDLPTAPVSSAASELEANAEYRGDKEGQKVPKP